MPLSLPIDPVYQVHLANNISSDGNKQCVIIRETHWPQPGQSSNTHYYCAYVIDHGEQIAKVPAESLEGAERVSNNWITGVFTRDTFVYTHPESE